MLSPAWSNAADAALEALRVATDRQVQAANDATTGGGGWESWIPFVGALEQAWALTPGPAAGASALRTNAAAARTFLATMEAKRSTLQTDDQAEAFCQTIGQFTDTSAIEATARELTALGGVARIAGDSWSDAESYAGEAADVLGNVAAGAGVVVLVVAALALVVLLRR